MALAQHNKEHIDVVEICSHSVAPDSKVLQWNNIEIPIYDKVGTCLRKYRYSQFPEFLILLFKNYDTRKNGDGKIYETLLKEFEISESESTEIAITPKGSPYTGVYHKLYQELDSISPDSPIKQHAR